MNDKTNPLDPLLALSPCPFCGERAILHSAEDEDAYHWWVQCSVCGAVSGERLAESTPDQEFAITAWNTRAANARGDGVELGNDERVSVDFYTSNPSAALFDMRRRISDKTITPGLQAAVSRLLASLKVETLVKPSTKNANAGFVDMRDWYALQGEVMAVESALTPPTPGSEAQT